MLGRQFHVLVTDEDLSEIEAVLRRKEDVQFLSSNTNEGRNSLLALNSLRVDESLPGPTRRRCFLAPAAKPPSVDIEPLSDVKVHISVERSEIIEFWRSYCEGGRIQANRVYYTPKYFDGATYDKNPEFVRWAEKTVSAIKRVLNYDKKLMAQVGKDAARKIASGELKVIV